MGHQDQREEGITKKTITNTSSLRTWIRAPRPFGQGGKTDLNCPIVQSYPFIFLMGKARPRESCPLSKTTLLGIGLKPSQVLQG